MRALAIALAVLSPFFAQADPILAQDDPALVPDSGPYIGLEMGLAFGPALNLTGSDNDWSTLCDKIINPLELETGGSCATAPPLTEWVNDLGGGRGVLAGLAVGYRRDRLRLEASYAFRGVRYDQLVATRIGDAVTLQKADQELELAEGGADDVTSHEFFANAYYDFAHGARVTPYVGVGVGMASVSVDYLSRWKRNDDPAQIATFADPGLRDKVAGTTTLGWGRLTDLMTGAQGIVGLDYSLDGRATVGLKLRWTVFSGFEAEKEWAQLRSHESSVGRGFPVVYTVKTKDIGGAALSIDLRYRL